MRVGAAASETMSMPTTDQIAAEFSALNVQWKHALTSLGEHYLHRLLFSYFSGAGPKEKARVELNAILSGLIPGFGTIESHTMSDINRIIEQQKRDLEAKLARISGNDLAAMIAERRSHETRIEAIDARLRQLCGDLGIDVGLGASPREDRRPKLSDSELDAKILEVLRNAPQGLSQVGISEAVGVSYGAVVKWLKENPDKVRAEGERRGRRVYLR